MYDVPATDDLKIFLLNIVGSPIHVKKNKNPSRRHVNRTHKKYILSLTQLFEQNKTKYGIKDSTPLHIVWPWGWQT